jgi:hypothetical protein
MREPGAYEVVGTYVGDPRTPYTTNEPIVPVKSDPIRITVLPRTKQEMSDYIKGLTNQIATHMAGQTNQYRGAHYEELQKLWEKLTYTCSPEIVPTLLRNWDDFNADPNIYAIWIPRALLFYVPHTEAIRKAIVEAAAKRDSNSMNPLLVAYDRNSEGIKTITPP